MISYYITHVCCMMVSGEWKTAPAGSFKSYNVDSPGPAVDRYAQQPHPLLTRCSTYVDICIWYMYDDCSGCLHPLLKVRTEIRKFLLEMGFTEMPTNNFVESSFWNFDALFQPQQHAVRDSHDTFFLTGTLLFYQPSYWCVRCYLIAPERTIDIPMDYLGRVKEMHEYGGSGSVG